MEHFLSTICVKLITGCKPEIKSAVMSYPPQDEEADPETVSRLFKGTKRWGRVSGRLDRVQLQMPQWGSPEKLLMTRWQLLHRGATGIPKQNVGPEDLLGEWLLILGSQRNKNPRVVVPAVDAAVSQGWVVLSLIPLPYFTVEALARYPWGI